MRELNAEKLSENGKLSETETENSTNNLCS